MKVLYPELVFGAIASSGEYCVRVTTQANAQFGHPLNLNILAVTHAALENWEYMEIIRQAADPKCAAHLENTVRTIDSILLRGDDAVSKALKRHLKGLFGVADLEHDEDFVSLVEVSLEFQPQYTMFRFFCRVCSLHSARGKQRTGTQQLAVTNSKSSAKLWTSLSSVIRNFYQKLTTLPITIHKHAWSRFRMD